jgi:dipeptidyl aminopeptidase/acylaminoacyl peptidase
MREEYMEDRVRRSLVGFTFFVAASVASAEQQPIERFARMPYMRDVTVSPDGRHVAFLSGMDDTTVIASLDLQGNGEFRRLAGSDPGKFDVRRCAWANSTRLICEIAGNIRGRRYAEPPFSRLMAVDADGGKLKVLDVRSQKGNPLQASTSAKNLNNVSYFQGAGVGAGVSQSSDYGFRTYGERTTSMFDSFSGGQRSDKMIDVLPEDHDLVLIQTDEDGSGWPSVLSLDVYGGSRGVRLRGNPPIREVLTDGNGAMRLGWTGRAGGAPEYFGRAPTETQWSPLSRLTDFASQRGMTPFVVDRERDVAYAIGESDGRGALWSVDLRGARDPEVVFKHPRVDVGDPLMTNDRRMIGVRYDVERPSAFYPDEALRKEMARFDARNPAAASLLVDLSRDDQMMVIRSFSDVDDGTYYLYDRRLPKLSRLGSAYPDLAPDSLGTTKPITYKAADGTDIPGYLTVPSGAKPENLPLVVLPHDGPAERDTWQFNFLRAFLANRGYAVLQMNYRGSVGYGDSWVRDAHQGWGGVTYSDVNDATRWAVAQGIADPKRVCIAGWGFGGYTALLGAARNSELYRCAISIAGISDLEMARESMTMFGRRAQAYFDDQVGTDAGKVAQDSPAQQAASVAIPVLLVHGDLDWRVQIDQSKKMEAALRKNHKECVAIYLKGAGHELDRKSDRMTLLKEVETFLRKNLGPGAQAG